MEESSRELFSAFLEEISIIKRENRILRETISSVRFQVDRLSRDVPVLTSENLSPLPHGADEALNDPEVEED